MRDKKKEVIYLFIINIPSQVECAVQTISIKLHYNKYEIFNIE